MTEILKLLEQNGRYTIQELAALTGKTEEETAAIVKECEDAHIINGYTALVDWDRTSEEAVTALIEVRVTPQRDDGFDRIAKRIYQYEEVDSVYLMSGAYDLTVIISAKSLKEVSHFISTRLSTIDGVLSTATHFILKKYKEKGRAFLVESEQEERPLFV